MAIQALIEKIKQKAANECEAILKAGQSKADEATRLTIEKAQEKAEKILVSAEEQAFKISNEGLQKIKLQLNIMTLESKHKLLDDAFSNAKQNLLSLSDKEWVDLHTKLVVENCFGEDITIKVPATDKDKYINPEFIQKATSSNDGSLIQIWSKTLSDSCGKPCTVSVDEQPANFDGGFILCCKNYDVNLSYDAILDDISQEHIIEISNCLFAENEADKA